MGQSTNHKKQKGSTEVHQNTVKIALLKLTTKHSRVWANNTGAISLKDCGYCNTSARFITFGLKGSSDIIGIYKGIFIGVEIKTGNAFQSKFQKVFEKMVCNMRGIYIVIRETNVTQILNIAEKRYQEIINEKLS